MKKACGLEKLILSPSFEQPGYLLGALNHGGKMRIWGTGPATNSEPTLSLSKLMGGLEAGFPEWLLGDKTSPPETLWSHLPLLWSPLL